jgi:hypothetical protein
MNKMEESSSYGGDKEIRKEVGKKVRMGTKMRMMEK